MFFGAIPISTKISCLPWMLDNGMRGILIDPNLDSAVNTICNTIKNKDLTHMAVSAQKWSQQYTLDALEKAIYKTLTE